MMTVPTIIGGPNGKPLNIIAKVMGNSIIVSTIAASAALLMFRRTRAAASRAALRAICAVASALSPDSTSAASLAGSFAALPTGASTAAHGFSVERDACASAWWRALTRLT